MAEVLLKELQIKTHTVIYSKIVYFSTIDEVFLNDEGKSMDDINPHLISYVCVYAQLMAFFLNESTHAVVSWNRIRIVDGDLQM